MDQFEWTDDMNLGIDVIDAQHRQIVNYINALSNAIRLEDVDSVFDTMERLKDYTMDHFAFEEQLMNKAGYVLLDAHQQVHRRFEQRIEDLEEDLKVGRDPLGVARRVRITLMHWLIQHIRHEDVDYVPVVKKVLARERSWIKSTLTKIFGSTESA